MNTVALIVALFVACASCLSEQEYQSSFTQWMQSNQRSYTAVEFQTRYGTFKNNMDYIEKWNLANEETKLGLTIMADLSNEEYRRLYLGTRSNGARSNVLEQDLLSKASVTLPASVDWLTSGAVTPIKNQGQCGGCWSFSTTGSVEGIHQIATGNLVSLSEQNLLDCSDSFGNEGCNGGLMDNAFKYIISNNGIDTEASYPYTAVQGQCQFNAANVGATITGYTDVTSGSESALQIAVVQQPVSVAIDASHNSFQLYKSGVYYEPACSATKLDHGVLSIGYGVSGSSDYWLVKNSWGTSWGQAGYIWMSRNRNNNCGIATAASYPTGGGGSSSNSNSGNGNTGNSGNGNTGNSGNGNTGNSGNGNTGNGNTGNNGNNGNSNTGHTNGNSNTGTSKTSYSSGIEVAYNKAALQGGKGFKAVEKFNF